MYSLDGLSMPLYLSTRAQQKMICGISVEAEGDGPTMLQPRASRDIPVCLKPGLLAREARCWVFEVDKYFLISLKGDDDQTDMLQNS